MTLTIELELPRPDVPIGGEIALRSTLRNQGEDAVEVASLFDNNKILNYAILDDQGRLLKTVNHITRQLLMGRGEPRTEDFKLMTLAPGAHEVREDNLCRYEWFDRPGTYFVRCFYQWQGYDVWSEPQRLEILAAPLHAYDQQWTFHYGERFLLQSAWVATLPGGISELFLRESMRSRPTVINHNHSLGVLPGPIEPRVSFDRSLMAGGSVWLAWLSEGTVTVLKTKEGKAQGPPRAHILGLDGLDWASAPVASGADDLVMFLSAAKPGGGRLVMALHVGPDGSELDRHVVTTQMPGAVAIHGVCESDDAFHLFWVTGDTEEVWHLPVSLSTLQPTEGATCLWKLGAMPLALLTAPVWTNESYLGCLSLPSTGGEPDHVSVAWLQLDPPSNPLKVVAIPAAGLRGVGRCTGETTDSGRVFALLSSREVLVYLNGSLAQSRIVASTSDVYPGSEVLTINTKNDVFLVSNRVGVGLSETLIHGGLEEDLSQATEVPGS